ncbi:MAG: Hsp20/alpha crystallin family protein [Methanospirillaceae archaeon]|nr:Hsp20/alpha crystallin family protein [Methanospirillaceae archaeon]
MTREKHERNKTDVMPVTPGSSMATRRFPGLIEHDFDSLFDDLRKSFDLMMRPYFPVELSLRRPEMIPIRYPPLDFIDGGDHYLIKIELPGFTREDVDVQVTPEGVTVSAKKEEEKEEEKKNYIHRERSYSTYERAIVFPEEVDPSKAQGTMKEGILELKVMKKEVRPEQKPRKLELQ